MTHWYRGRADIFKPVPERLVTCRHGDAKSLCLLCRSERDTTLCEHDRVAEACRYCSREDHMEDAIGARQKPPADPLGFCLWLQSQDTDCLAEWIKQSC
jgi:hypothetical protein